MREWFLWKGSLLKIGIGNDHVAVEYKEAITAYIQRSTATKS